MGSRGPVCRGSYALGTACGACERCEEERARRAVPKTGLHRPPPRVQTTYLPPTPPPTVFPGGFIGWPGVFLYEWRDAAGGLRRTALPPPRVPRELWEELCRRTEQGRMEKRPDQAPSWPYRVVVLPSQLAQYEALSRGGELQSDLHRPTWEALLKDQQTPSSGPYAIHLLPRQPDGALYPTVAGDGWALTHSEAARGGRRVTLPPELQACDPATLLQLCYEQKLDLSGDVAKLVEAAALPAPAPASFAEDGYDGG